MGEVKQIIPDMHYYLILLRVDQYAIALKYEIM